MNFYLALWSSYLLMFAWKKLFNALQNATIVLTHDVCCVKDCRRKLHFQTSSQRGSNTFPFLLCATCTILLNTNWVTVVLVLSVRLYFIINQTKFANINCKDVTLITLGKWFIIILIIFETASSRCDCISNALLIFFICIPHTYTKFYIECWTTLKIIIYILFFINTFLIIYKDICLCIARFIGVFVTPLFIFDITVNELRLLQFKRFVFTIFRLPFYTIA